MTFEAYAKATSSRNLTWSDHSTNDVDWLVAAAMCAGMEAKLPGALARLMAGEPDTLWPVVEILERGYGRKRRVSQQAKREIEAAVLWWMNPACQTCNGLGHPKHDDAPHLEEQLCLACVGTGYAGHDCSGRAYAESLKRLEEAKGQCQRRLSNRIGLDAA